jgi:hypothetical protein
MLRITYLVFCLLFMSISSIHADVLYKQWIERASQGYLPTVKIGLGTTKDEVIKKVGKPDGEEAYLMQYKNVSFYLNEEKRVSSILIDPPERLSTNDLFTRFGQPDYEDNHAFRYKAGRNYLVFYMDYADGKCYGLELTDE